MSGGTFDYAQYRIDDIVARIEEEIERATCERPPLVREAKVGVKENRGDGWRYPPHLQSFRTLSSAELHFVGLGYKIQERVEQDGGWRTKIKDPITGDLVEIWTYIDEHYAPDEDGEIPCFSEWSEETLQEFRRGIAVLKRAIVYAQRIDWLLSGDDGEDTFHERLKEELDKLDKEEEK